MPSSILYTTPHTSYINVLTKSYFVFLLVNESNSILYSTSFSLSKKCPKSRSIFKMDLDFWDYFQNNAQNLDPSNMMDLDFWIIFKTMPKI